MADAYRYNPPPSACRVVDERFRELERVDRIDLIEPALRILPEQIEGDIVTILPLTPEELEDPQAGGFRTYYLAREFEEAGPVLD